MGWIFELVGIFPWLQLFGLTFGLLVLREYCYQDVYLSAVTIWSKPFVTSFMLFDYTLTFKRNRKRYKILFRLFVNVWIRLITVNLFYARDLWCNNAPVLQFWYLSSTLTLQVHAFETSESHCVSIILSQFICKSKYAVINQ